MRHKNTLINQSFSWSSAYLSMQRVRGEVWIDVHVKFQCVSEPFLAVVLNDMHAHASLIVSTALRQSILCTCFTLNPSVSGRTVTDETINLVFTSASVLAGI